MEYYVSSSHYAGLNMKYMNGVFHSKKWAEVKAECEHRFANRLDVFIYLDNELIATGDPYLGCFTIKDKKKIVAPAPQYANIMTNDKKEQRWAMLDYKRKQGKKVLDTIAYLNK